MAYINAALQTGVCHCDIDWVQQRHYATLGQVIAATLYQQRGKSIQSLCYLYKLWYGANALGTSVI